ncbi:DUF4923 family protein [Dysgonomonas macrotermitis]|uniref:DUF4923 domain-containing protein n=1 Tax=Dysgonomonas macrotermitis TaxID=1346286 RepID=A0A1M4YN63_9BACT|nr:DUF4923 family protein [Dysgonomonas macrotermitis]SHF07077.1 protein of unknown function [Dysgonomonas macrotermitis]
MKKNRFYLLMACIFLFTGAVNTMQAQSVSKIFKSAVNHFSSLDLEGTWVYQGAVVQFESDNLLKKAGGKVAAASLDKKINDQLNNIGFQAGVTVFTFNADSTFTNTTGGKKMSGKYTYDSNTKYITLKYLNHVPLKAKLSGSGDSVSLLFEANGFLSMITFIGGHTGISAVSSLNSILKSYDGMMVGMELKKQ